MSLPAIESLKPASSLELRKISRQPENFTTSVLSHICSMEFGGFGVGAKLINNDPSNPLVYRLHSDVGTARSVPPSAEITVLEWFDIIVITPDGTTGTGQLEIDVVPFEDARRK